MGFPRQEYWSGSPFPCVCLCLTEYMYNGILGFPGGSDGKESACNVGDLGLILGLGRSPGEGNDNPLQYFCLQNSMDKETTVHGITESDTTEQLTLTN